LKVPTPPKQRKQVNDMEVVEEAVSNIPGMDLVSFIPYNRCMSIKGDGRRTKIYCHANTFIDIIIEFPELNKMF